MCWVFPSSPSKSRLPFFALLCAPEVDFYRPHYQAPLHAGLPLESASRSSEGTRRVVWVFRCPVRFLLNCYLVGGLFLYLPPLSYSISLVLLITPNSRSGGEGAVMAFHGCWSLGTSPLLSALWVCTSVNSAVLNSLSHPFKGALCFLMADTAPQFPFETLPLSPWIELAGHHYQGCCVSLVRMRMV